MLSSIKRKLRGGGTESGVAGGTGAVSSPPPRSDVALPPRRERRRSSIIREEKVAALKDLPMLKDTPLTKREALFRQKLELCCVMFNFDVSTSNKRGKELKRVTLLELVDYVNSAGGQKVFCEAMMPDIVKMVSVNLFRTLPPQTEDYDPEEDEPVLEASWPHLQVVYEFFLRFIVSSEVKSKNAKKYVTQKFCLKLIELFDSEDPRERDYLKTILHRIYGKFMSYRSFVRRSIRHSFYQFVYETERHNGIGEMLEILGSIINGFALPLKPEHVDFLEHALIPLHRPKCVALYHQQLAYCAMQYVEKDPQTAVRVILGLVKCWPWSCSTKQVVFLNELEEVLELTGPEQLERVVEPLFRCIAKCISSPHFQVAERVLFLWNNDHLLNHGCLSKPHRAQVLPVIFGALYSVSQHHWNGTVESLADNVLKHYSENNYALYERCAATYQKEQEEEAAKMEERSKRWEALEKLASTSSV